MTDRPFRDDRRATMARFDASWERVRRRLRALADDAAARPSAETAVTLPQVVAHLAHWEEREAAALRARLEGRSLPDADSDDGVLNARWMTEDLYVSLDDAERRLADAHALHRGALEALDESLWDEVGEEAAVGPCGIAHYEAHVTEPLRFPIDRETLLGIFEERWHELRERLARVTDERAPAAAGNVTPGAAVAHIARWDEGSVEVIDARRSDQDASDPYAGRDREWNARWLAEDADVAVADALERFDRAHAALAERLHSIDDAAWQAYGVGYAAGTAEHYRSHAERLLEFPLPG